ncbi:MAG: formate/nitrite family transporter [Alphaproteobacteria bacterium]
MTDGNPHAPHNHGIDALLPAEMAVRAEEIGVAKTRQEASRLFVLAILAGAFIGLGAMFATTVMADTIGILPFGLKRMLAGFVFALGLILVILGGAELFTGNTLMVMAWAARKVRLSEMLRAWAIVYLGNFAGAIGTAALVFLSGQYLSGHGNVAAVAITLAEGKATLPFDQALFLGILCNVLVCLAVWLSLGARTTADKVLAVIFPVAAFVAAGFEHSVANMYLIPLGLFMKAWAPATLWPDAGIDPAALAQLTWANFFESLVPVTIGNVIGGGGLVGGVYWFVYLRPRGKTSPQP